MCFETDKLMFSHTDLNLLIGGFTSPFATTGFMSPL